MGTYHTVAVTTPRPTTSSPPAAATRTASWGWASRSTAPAPNRSAPPDGWAQVDASLTHAAGVRDDHSLWTWGYDIDGALGGSGGLNAPARVGLRQRLGVRLVRRLHRRQLHDGAQDRPARCGPSATTAPGSSASATRTSRAVPTQVGIGRRLERRSPPATASVTGPRDSRASRTRSTTTRWRSRPTARSGPGARTTTASSASATPPAAWCRCRSAWTTDWAAVACGDDYSAALKTDGTLWVWGRNQFGQLGKTDLVDRHVPTQVLTGAPPRRSRRFACGSRPRRQPHARGQDRRHPVGLGRQRFR